MNGAFNSQILTEKLQKLNNSQQSIETLSHWCIFHRKKARLVVETWEKQFRKLSKDQQVPFLYLANDIIQNSRRRGSEFVTEFWKVLPTVLKEVLEKADDRVHNVVFRLVDIWDDRKVFGSRTRTLRDELLGNEPPADLAQRRVKSNHTIKIKVPVGGIQEKLTSAYRSVQDVACDEDATLGRCNAAVTRIEGLEKEANLSKNLWESHDTTLADELKEQENILMQCAEQLEMSELARAALISHLKEALREQESKLEMIRAQLKTARSRAEQTGILRQRFLQSANAGTGEIVEHGPQEMRTGAIGASAGAQNTHSGDNLSWSTVPFTEGLTTVIEEAKNPRNVAAEVAAKLAASASSAQMLQSVLSSFVAQEASNARSESAALEASAAVLPDKRQKVNSQNNDHMKNGDDSPSYAKHSALPIAVHSLSVPVQLTSQMEPSSTSQLQYPSRPGPAILTQPHFTSIHVSGFGYTSSAPTMALSPMLPPQPPPPTLIQQQVVMGVPSSMSTNSQKTNPGAFQSLQSPVGYYGQLPLQAPNLSHQ